MIVMIGYGESLGFIRTSQRAGASLHSPLSWWGGCCTHQLKQGVTNAYRCAQTKCQTLFLAHDPEKWRWASLILLFLTATANVTLVSLDCHENLP